jgi:hypothetical protein
MMWHYCQESVNTEIMIWWGILAVALIVVVLVRYGKRFK